MKSVPLLALFLFSSIASASPQTCTNASVPAAPLGQVRDQGISGLCFAYEAADLISFKTRTRVSAIDLALNYFQGTKMKRMSEVYQNGGESGPAILAAAKIGACPESDMPSEETVLDSVRQIGKIQMAFLWLEKNSWNTAEAFHFAQMLFPKITEEDFAAARALPRKKSRLAHLQLAACPDRVETADFKFVYRKIDKALVRSQAFRMIDEQLDKQNPVGIGFYSGEIFAEQDTDDSHAATIVARRWNDARGTCEYLIRDTFGEQCSSYKSKFECNRGNIWVDTAFLNRTLFEFEYLE